MAVTYGFFNSVNGDRKYNAEQMSEYFRGIINEGVYQHLDGGLAVTAGTGLAVNVAAGRAIIQNRWVQNSAAMSLTIAAASETYARKDAVVIRLNWSSRSISIAVKTGTPAASPVAPSMTRNSTTYEMALAYVNVAANATSVTVTDKRSDSTVCGWVTVAQSTSGEVDAMLNDMKTGFDGVPYNTPGAAVRGCDQKIKDLLFKYEYDQNIINEFKGENGYFIGLDGTVSANSGWFLSDYIPVPNGAVGIIGRNYASISGGTRMNDVFATFDENKTFISAVGSDNVTPLGLEKFILKSNVKYVRFNIYTRDLSEWVDYFNFGTYEQKIDSVDIAGYYNRTYKKAITNDGTIISHNDFGYSDYIPVPKWANQVTLYNKVTTGGQDYPFVTTHIMALYDNDLEFIRTVAASQTIGYDTIPIDPAEASYIRFNFGTLTESGVVCVFSIAGDANSTIKWDNKTGDFLGDSITAQGQYTAKMTSLYGITVNNYGVSGTCISNVNGSNYFAARVSTMSTSCDFVFMLGGTNDWGLGAPLGTKTDTTVDTFYGGLYATLSALRERFPTKPIFVSTILQRDWTQTQDQSSGIDSNANGNSVMEFNEAIIYMAHRFGAIVIDGFGESGICIPNITTYTNDRLHLNATGGTRYATYIKDVMETISPY